MHKNNKYSMQSWDFLHLSISEEEEAYRRRKNGIKVESSNFGIIDLGEGGRGKAGRISAMESVLGFALIINTVEPNYLFQKSV